ncbi:hypothetical protein YPPY45_4474, partial [Yersinia pestis PY-45]
MINTAPP